VHDLNGGLLVFSVAQVMPAQAQRGNLITMLAEVSDKNRRHVLHLVHRSTDSPAGFRVAPETVGFVRRITGIDVHWEPLADTELWRVIGKAP
jgi:hypothetical protein